MNKIILVDGNNLLFRSYYATAYNGNFMNNSKGFPTNALFGFTNMINKIILEEKPQYIIVAFDKGKTFRHEEYADYKGGRSETPNELKIQFPKAKELLTAMGITYYEIDNYEADDIIGTFAHYCDLEPDFIGTIISSDKDLLQLISPDVDIKLLKQKDYIRYNEESFKKAYGFEPIHMIDLKALMGDASDNIPGVRGVGEKTALKLISEYKTLDNLYDHIDEIKGKLKDKLLEGKTDAYKSKHLCTIVKDAPLEINLKDIKYQGTNHEKLNKIYEELEFYSFLKREVKEDLEVKSFTYDVIKDINDLKITKPFAFYLSLEGENYHTGKIHGIGIYNEEFSCFIPSDVLLKSSSFFDNIEKYTYDLKKNYVALKWHDINLSNVSFDTMIAGYLLELNIKDDMAYLANEYETDMLFYDALFNKKQELNKDLVYYNAVIGAKFIYDTKNMFQKKLIDKDLFKLFKDIEMPLALTLGDMEYNGVYVSRSKLEEMGEELKLKMELTSNTIYNYAGHTFNISSPNQLGVVLFDELKLPVFKKTKKGYSTNIEVLNKLKGKHPIIEEIINYRAFSKLYSTYVEGLINCIHDDQKIHTIYTQTLTRTGRLSSIEPNLQNIPMRSEEGKLIRKAFLPSPNSVIISSDYSQIELRILAHMAQVESLIQAFKNGEDIHTKTARDIFNVLEPTKNMRRIAKAVNFGIIYGISSYGLSENTNLTPSEASTFIHNYFTAYPGIKTYMDKTIKQAHDKGYVKTLFGRIRTIPELNNANVIIKKQGERMALNAPIQGTSADIIKKAMIEIHAKIKKEKMQAKMILQVHDELVFDCPKNEEQKLKTLIREIMENTYKLDVPLKVDIEVGLDWYQAK